MDTGALIELLRAGHLGGAALDVLDPIPESPQDPLWSTPRLLITPKARDQVLAAKLVAFGLSQLASLPSKPIEIEHPASDQVTQAALTEAGFTQAYALVHMRLDLSREQNRQGKETV